MTAIRTSDALHFRPSQPLAFDRGGAPRENRSVTTDGRSATLICSYHPTSRHQNFRSSHSNTLADGLMLTANALALPRRASCAQQAPLDERT